MKRLFYTFVVALLLASPALVHAIDLGGGFLKKAGDTAGYEAATETTLSENIGSIINIILSFVGVIFTVLLVYAGYLWMTARGKDDQVDKAKDIIRQSIIGIVITLGAYSVTNFIIPRVLEATLK